MKTETTQQKQIRAIKRAVRFKATQVAFPIFTHVEACAVIDRIHKILRHML